MFTRLIKSLTTATNTLLTCTKNLGDIKFTSQVSNYSLFNTTLSRFTPSSWRPLGAWKFQSVLPNTPRTAQAGLGYFTLTDRFLNHYPSLYMSCRYLFEITRDCTKRTFGFTWYYLQGLTMVLCIDACLTDDEPLWEPIEWSLVQTWLLFIFGFAWIAENLIVSRFGSYTGRDKRVWFAWYKSFWLIELWYAISYGAAISFVIVPFYFETNYSMSFIFSWWHWYSRVFFFKFISLFSVILLLSYVLQTGVRWLNWRKGLVIILLINVFLSYLLYTHFFITFFSYFTDPIWYQKNPTDRLRATKPRTFKMRVGCGQKGSLYVPQR